MEFDLPREVEHDPFYVDEVAVERACLGERVPLTPTERAVAFVRLMETEGYHRACLTLRVSGATAVALRQAAADRGSAFEDVA